MLKKNVRLLAASLTMMAGAFSSQAHADLVTNGDFATGDFTGWTLGLTPYGTFGAPPLPQVSSFDVTGSGATNAAQFSVGVESYDQPGGYPQAGGFLTQTIATSAGNLHVSANIAAYASEYQNIEGGVFSVLLNAVTEDTVSFGALTAGQIDRGTLSFTTPVSAGPQTLEILITRPFGTDAPFAPFQYVTDISATPGPKAGEGLLGFAAMFALLVAVRFRGLMA